MLKKLFSVTFFSLAVFSGFSQEDEGGQMDTELASKVIMQRVNQLRIENKVDTLIYNDLLTEASIIQSEDMAAMGKASLDNGKYPTTGDRLMSCGGSAKAQEVVVNLGALKGKDMLPLSVIADEAIKKWGKKEMPILIDPNHVYIGASMRLDEAGKKAYISVVLGGLDIYNNGADKKKRKEIKPRYTKKDIFTPANEKACKNCEKFNDYQKLLDGIYVEGKYVYIKYDDLKGLAKLIKKDGDGLAIDIVQKSQYENSDYNIMNKGLQTKGIVRKPVGYATLESKNRAELAEGEKKLNRLDAPLGKFHKKIKGDYEINLLVIQGGTLCKTLVKNYTEQGDQESNTPLIMLLMQDSSAYFNPPFVPKSETVTLKFTIPFEKNKSEYKEEDLLPFINSMNEPDFIINSLFITAYSSIEGDPVTNASLQKRRSENIIKALKKMQKTNVITDVKTSDSWSLFQMMMEDTEYKALAKMTKEEAIDKINGDKQLVEKLEPYLAKQRFAEIVMEVSYDIKGAKEEKYSIAKFNQAVKKGDVTQALKIQYYIAQKVREGKYTPGAMQKLIIPQEAKFSGLLNNQIVFNYYKNDTVATEEDYEKMKALSEIDPENGIVSYNKLFGMLKFDNSSSKAADVKERAAVQSEIDGIYKGGVPEIYANALNIEWQFRVIDAVDTAEGSAEVVEACIKKVKSFFNLEESSKENNLKLAYIFAKFHDYEFATSLLSEYVKEDKVEEPLLFAYISFAAHIPELVNSKTFAVALEKADKTNHSKYCKLFGEPYLSFQVLDNPMVKEYHNKAACE